MDARENKVLKLAVRAGEIMLKSGGEVYRTEDTVKRICYAAGMCNVECFITTTGVIVSLDDHRDKEAEIQTAVKRIKVVSTDLEKVSQIHGFVRRFAALNHHTEVDIDKGMEELERIDATVGFTLPIRFAAVVLIAAFFTLMNNGSVIDGLFTVGAAAVTYLFTLLLKRLPINYFIVVFCSCFLAAGLSLLFYSLGYCSSFSAMVIGSVTIFLPGAAITNAVRDMLSGDMLAGVARGAEALLVTVAIAGGVGLMLNIAPVPVPLDTQAPFIFPLEFLFAFLGTIGIAIIVNIPRRYLLIAGLIAGSGWLVYELILMTGNSRIIACFLATCSIALIAEVATRLSKDAATLFIIPAIYPLVPGKVMFAAMLEMINDNIESALSIGAEAILLAGSIAVALLVVISLTRIVSLAYRGIRKISSSDSGTID